MVRIMDLIDWLESYVPYPYFINDFPATAPDVSAVVRLMPGEPLNPYVPIPRPDFQVVLRSARGEDLEAEAAGHNLLIQLHRKSGGQLSGYRLVLCKSEQSVPFYLGSDDNGRPLYSVNFQLTLL